MLRHETRYATKHATLQQMLRPVACYAKIHGTPWNIVRNEIYYAKRHVTPRSMLRHATCLTLYQAKLRDIWRDEAYYDTRRATPRDMLRHETCYATRYVTPRDKFLWKLRSINTTKFKLCRALLSLLAASWYAARARLLGYGQSCGISAEKYSN